MLTISDSTHLKSSAGGWPGRLSRLREGNALCAVFEGRLSNPNCGMNDRALAAPERKSIEGLRRVSDNAPRDRIRGLGWSAVRSWEAFKTPFYPPLVATSTAASCLALQIPPDLVGRAGCLCKKIDPDGSLRKLVVGKGRENGRPQ
jgi:hypothetical protein